MKTITTKLNINPSYPLMTPYEWEDIIFFDIETTGFSANTAYLYLIGCMYYKDNSWQITQWLADDMNSEQPILEAFFQILKSHKRLVHFNGTGFDIPFILQKCRKHNLGLSFNEIESYDIYKKILKIKKLLPLPNYKLKTVEKFVGINRRDTFSGEELIQIYANYLGRLQYEKLLQKSSQNKAAAESNNGFSITRIERDNTKNLSSLDLSEIILLHNFEDVKGLIRVADMLFYLDIFENCPLEAVSYKEEPAQEDTLSAFNHEEQLPSLLCLHSVLPFHLAQPVTLHTSLPAIGTPDTENQNPSALFSVKLILTDNELTLKLPVYNGELKYYFENYRDYFYLPKEDTAIHKSVAQYVDKEFKVKAKPANCYNKKKGSFLPQSETLFKPDFKNTPADKITYFELSDTTLEDSKNLNEYVKSILQYILTNKATTLVID